MKKMTLVSALLLAASLSSGAMAAENRFSMPEAGSNMDTVILENHINVSHAFDEESLTAGTLL
ncbi:hypothetical protein [Leclercia sp. UBA1284]|uniref:hypothetical protein n=1 Tax=Leclercia sp. UBA1284 TaxID=1946737 RepID=UPI00257F69D2|nr:hypothetical protein [Leclercia sp. UBA1284]